MATITPFLWFDGAAEEAMAFYSAIFPDAETLNVTRSGDPQGKVLSATFRLQGQTFIALNGGPHFTFSPAVSFFVSCDTQAEVDHYWDSLSAGGEQMRCGWLKDRFGLSWQIVPTTLPTLLRGPDADASSRVMQAMMGMTKLDIAALKAAADAR